jgi:hypothetical protein
MSSQAGNDEEPVSQDYLAAFNQVYRRASDRLANTIQQGSLASPAHALTATRIYRVMGDLFNVLFDGRMSAGQFITLEDAENLSSAASLMAESAQEREGFAEGARMFTDVAIEVLHNVRRTLYQAGFNDDAIPARDELVGKIDELVPRLTEVKDVVLREMLTNLVDSVTKTRDEVADVKADVLEAAGETGAVSLAQHFEDYAWRQDVRAWLMRGISAILIGGSVFLATFLLERLQGANLLTAEVARLLVVVPILVFAYYFIREAGHHRDASMHAKENAVRLQTIGAYAADLSQEDKDKVRSALGIRVFGGGIVPRLDSDELINLQDPSAFIAALTTLIGTVKK